MAKLDITQLLHSLQNLFYRISHMHLTSRIHAYQGEAGRGEVKDISAPLNEHLETLAGKAAEKDAVSEPEAANRSETADEPKVTEPVKRERSRRMPLIRRSMNGLSKMFKRRGSSIVVQPHLSDELQRRVRQHLNTSLRKARQGDIVNAKLYANLASNAIHELNRYMPKEDFNRFNSQICSDLKEFKERDFYKPLTELMK